MWCAPLSRILGIIDLIEGETENFSEMLFLKQLRISTNEMDGIVEENEKETTELKKNKMKKELYIIDDDLIFRMIVSKTINKMDSSLVINQCENGAIGLNMLKEQSDANYKIIVLLDKQTSY
jgi:hypothetical protein